ncbi:hypothetical protein JMUB6875_17160 [Nocardia sp. JMUB6875]|uniref:Vgb family protein n=1 Tax=Nocardia sp. JMUB6875 TaxID=3158170 RepID=UPI0032E59F05
MRLRGSARLLAASLMLVAAGPAAADPTATDLESAVTQIPIGAGRFAEGFTPGPDGAVWFCTLLGGYLGRIDTATYAVTRIPLPQLLAGGHELVVGSDGALWYPEFVTNRAGRYDPRTGEQREYELPFTFATENPIMAAGPDGAL